MVRDGACPGEVARRQLDLAEVAQARAHAAANGAICWAMPVASTAAMSAAASGTTSAVSPLDHRWAVIEASTVTRNTGSARCRAASNDAMLPSASPMAIWAIARSQPMIASHRGSSTPAGTDASVPITPAASPSMLAMSARPKVASALATSLPLASSSSTRGRSSASTPRSPCHQARCPRCDMAHISPSTSPASRNRSIALLRGSPAWSGTLRDASTPAAS